MASDGNWLAPSAEVWEARFGRGSFPGGMVGRYLKPLAAHHDPETIARHLAEYLDQTDPRWINLAKFAMTFASWAPREVVDEYGCIVEETKRHGQS